MTTSDQARSPAAEAPQCRRQPRWRLTVVASMLALGAALSGCDSGGKPVEPQTPTTDPNLLPANASSEHFAIERDREQVASSAAFVLFREEARHAPN